MKKQAFIALILCIFVLTALFIDIGNAITQTAQTIQSSGFITHANSVELDATPRVIVRQLGNPMPNWTGNITANVNAWVAAQPWIVGGAVIIDVEDIAPILWFNQAGFNGYVFNTTYGTWSGCGWTFTQLKNMVDAFHAQRVSVVLGITAICKDANLGWSSNIYQWIANNQTELAFTHPDGSLYLSAEGGHTAPFNWFANFTSNDPVSGATIGESATELFNTRLAEMINAGLQWDGIFGSEGFGSIGVWGGASATNSTFIDATSQSISKWALWTTMTLPIGWGGMSTASKIQWVMKNASMNYQEFAGYMYASNLFAPIHDTIQSLRSSSAFFTGLIFSPDKTWQDSKRNCNWGGWSPEVGYNATYLAQYCSDSTYIYFVDEEKTDWSLTMPQQEAYTASSIKSSNINFNVAIGLHSLNNNDEPAPMNWLYKEYLAEACDYVWVGGQRIASVNSGIIVIQYPDNTSQTGYFRSDFNEFFDWVGNVQKVLSLATPEYLGPTYVFTSARQAYEDAAWSSLNYTILQWTESGDLSNKPQNLNWHMNALYLPQVTLRYNAGGLTNVQDQILYAFGNGSLSLIVDSETNYMDAGILQDKLFSGSASTNPLTTFNVRGPPLTWQGDTYTKILSQTDPNARWIVGGYAGNSYTLPVSEWYSSAQAFYLRGYYPANGFIEIGMFTSSNQIQFGIYYNASSANFLYGQDFEVLPPDLVNRGIQWATKSPITSSNSLVETAVYASSKGITVPMWNMQNDAKSSLTLNINAAQLGLGQIDNYAFSWASEPSKTFSFSNWSDIPVTLNGADILVITSVA